MPDDLHRLTLLPSVIAGEVSAPRADGGVTRGSREARFHRAASERAHESPEEGFLPTSHSHGLPTPPSAMTPTPPHAERGEEVKGWPSVTARTGHIPVGLAIPSTAPLTAAEREAMAALARALDVMAANVRDALARNRVDLALDATIRTSGVGDQALSISAKLGRNR